MKIVFLEAQSIGDDIDLSGFDALGEVVKYPIATAEQTPELIADADVAVLSKIPVNEATIGAAKNLKLVCLTATGTNNLDKDYLDSHGMAQCSRLFYRICGTAYICHALLSVGKAPLL